MSSQSDSTEPPASATAPAFPWLELSSIQIKPILLYRGWFKQPYHARVVHGFHAWWLLQEGHITIEIEGKVYHIRPGEWVLLPTGGKRFQKFESGSVYTSVNFAATWENGIPLLQLAAPIIGRDSGTPTSLSALALNLCLAVENGSGPGNIALRQRLLDIPGFLKTQAALHSLMEALFREALQRGARITDRGKGDPRLELVLASLRHAPQAGPLPFEEWKSRTGLGRSQLDRLARRTLDMSLHQFRDLHLLTEARKRLTTQAVIKQVAKELGFTDTSHFCRWIRQHTGHTPQRLKTLQV